MKIIFWSDYACPYCYIGERRLHKAINKLGLADQIIFEPKAFELDPDAPATVVSDTPSRFARKYRMPLEQAIAQVEHISQLGRAEGIDFRYASTQYTSTFNAHRLMKLALSTNDKDIAAKTNELLFAAYFTENHKLAEDATLLKIGHDAGLDENAVKKMLGSDEFAAAVREDEREAAARGIHGVPYFIFPDGATVPGAVSENDFVQILQRNLSVINSIKAEQCGPNGCAVKF